EAAELALKPLEAQRTKQEEDAHTLETIIQNAFKSMNAGDLEEAIKFVKQARSMNAPSEQTRRTVDQVAEILEKKLQARREAERVRAEREQREKERTNRTAEKVDPRD